MRTRVLQEFVLCMLGTPVTRHRDHAMLKSSIRIAACYQVRSPYLRTNHRSENWQLDCDILLATVATWL